MRLSPTHSFSHLLLFRLGIPIPFYVDFVVQWRLSSLVRRRPTPSCIVIQLAVNAVSRDIYEHYVDQKGGVALKESLKSNWTNMGVVGALTLTIQYQMLQDNIDEPESLMVQAYIFFVWVGILSSTMGILLASLAHMYVEPLDDAQTIDFISYNKSMPSWPTLWVLNSWLVTLIASVLYIWFSYKLILGYTAACLTVGMLLVSSPYIIGLSKWEPGMGKQHHLNILDANPSTGLWPHGCSSPAQVSFPSCRGALRSSRSSTCSALRRCSRRSVFSSPNSSRRASTPTCSRSSTTSRSSMRTESSQWACSQRPRSSCWDQEPIPLTIESLSYGAHLLPHGHSVSGRVAAHGHAFTALF